MLDADNLCEQIVGQIEMERGEGAALTDTEHAGPAGQQPIPRWPRVNVKVVQICIR